MEYVRIVIAPGDDEHVGPVPAPVGGPAGSPGFLLWRVTLRWQRAVTAALRPLGLTHVQFVLLANVWWLASEAPAGGAPTQREIADHAGTDPMMTSTVLRGLEARGLVARAADPRDARVRRLAVTAPGRRLAQRAVTVVEAADRTFFGALERPDALLPLLRRLASDPAGPRP